MRFARSWPAGIAVILLAGCAAPAPVPSVSDAAPTGTPTPPAVQVTEPVSTLPLDCADLASLDDLQTRFAEALQVRIDQSSAPLSSYSAAFVQAGGLSCVWGGEDRTDGGWDQGLTLSILGDADAAFAASRAQNSGSAQIIDTLGDGSWFSCASASGSLECGGEVIVRGYWIVARVSDSVGVGTSDAQALFAAVLAPVVAAVSGAGDPRPAFEPPADAYAGTALCSDPAAAAAALGVDPAGLTVVDTVGEDLDQGSEAVRRGPGVRCSWGTADSPFAVSISVLPGGDWAMDRYDSQTSVFLSPLQAAAQPATLPGTERALLSCGDGCIAALTIDGSIVYLYLSDTYDVAQATSQATAFAAALGA